METAPLATDLTAQLARRLEDILRAMGSALVAYSGGVDSSVVLMAAHRALGERTLGVLADTESNTEDDLEIARRVANEHGLPMEIIAYSELAIENYAENPVNRCFYCKNELYRRLTALAAERGFAAVCDGTNRDDGGDYRPGLQAVSRHGVRSPLREAGLDKAAVRALARHYGLPNHNRPAAPCLSSRIPYGEAVTREKLDQVGRAEAFLRGLGFEEFRCRHHGQVARLELRPEDFPRALDAREAIIAELRSLGFHWVALDLGGFQSGNLNRPIAGQTSGRCPDSPEGSNSPQ